MIADIHTIEDDDDYSPAVFVDILKARRTAIRSGKVGQEIDAVIDEHVASRRADLWQAYQAETDPDVRFYIDRLIVRYEYFVYISIKILAGDDRSEEEIGADFNAMKILSFENMRHQRRN